jgi:sterol desaturase/sphingolipid hydroxylase (fatty acid hydroxylase superfamily)
VIAILADLGRLVHASQLIRSTAEACAIYGAFTLIVFVFEKRGGAEPGRYRTRHFFNDVAYTLFYKGGVYDVFVLAATTNALEARLTIPHFNLLGGVPWPVGLAVFWIGGDLLMYWWHRLQHANRFLWALHSVHHSQAQLNLLTASRRHPIENLTLTLLLFVGIFHWGLGIPTRGWMPLAATITCLTALQHAQLDWRFGPLYRVVVSPRFHAFHHSAESAHLNTNYGFLFSAWDYLFGTAVADQPRPVRYGVDGIDFHESLTSQLLMPFRLMWRWRRAAHVPASSAAAPRFEREIAAAGLLKRTGSNIESTVRGRSMGGALGDGTRIRITCARAERYPLGAVVAFMAGDVLIGHRVVARSRDRRGREGLVTRGDARLFCDPPIDPALVLGEVTARADGAAWASVPDPIVRGWLPRVVSALALGVVRSLASLDRDVASRLMETVLTCGFRARNLAARAAGSHG